MSKDKLTISRRDFIKYLGIHFITMTLSFPSQSMSTLRSTAVSPAPQGYGIGIYNIGIYAGLEMDLPTDQNEDNYS